MDRQEKQGDRNYRNNTGGTQQDAYPNLETLENNWKDMKQSYRKRFPDLKQEDVEYRSGEFESMMERVAQRTGRNRKQVHEDIQNWDSKNNPDWV